MNVIRHLIPTYLRFNSFSGIIKGFRGGGITPAPFAWLGASVFPDDWPLASSGLIFSPPLCATSLLSAVPAVSCRPFAPLPAGSLVVSVRAPSSAFISLNISLAILELAGDEKLWYTWRYREQGCQVNADKKKKNTCKYLFPSFACIRSALVFCLFILTGLNMYHKYSTETWKALFKVCFNGGSELRSSFWSVRMMIAMLPWWWVTGISIRALQTITAEKSAFDVFCCVGEPRWWHKAI